MKPDKASVRRAQTKIYHANLEAGNTLPVHSTFHKSHFGLCLRCRALVDFFNASGRRELGHAAAR